MNLLSLPQGVSVLKAAILGATGMVGQRFIEQLQNHPDFAIEVLSASERSAGGRYGESVEWTLEKEIPAAIKEMQIASTSVEGVEAAGKVDVIFSALPATVAANVEPEFAKVFPVFTNASAFRQEPDVPILIPEINADHVRIIKAQREKRGWKGFIVTNPNCTTVGLALSLKPIMDGFGISSVRMVSMQAVSGAGFRGQDAVSAMQITDNVIPFIKMEEAKVEFETRKILGAVQNSRFRPAPFDIETSCNRVPVLDGHTECVFVETKRKVDPGEAEEAMAGFKGQPQQLHLPSAPKRPIWVFKGDTRPQPRYDRMLEGGMAIAVGRVRAGSSNRSLRYVSVVHNTIRGSAGGSVLNAELMKAGGYL